MKIFTSFVVTLFLLSACKTTEELQREQMVDNLSIQMAQNQKITAETKVKLQEIDERLNQINGALEEQGHKVDKTYSSRMQQNQDKIALLEKIQQEQSDKISRLEEELAAQKKYIEDVLKILKKVDRTVQEQKPRTQFEQAFYLFNHRKYKQAMPLLITLLSDKKIKGKKRARLLNALGTIHFKQGNDKKAIVYFSKLFTKYPKTQYTTGGLIYLARAFYRQGEKEQAISALEMLIKQYPWSKRVKKAKELLQKYQK